MLSGKFIKFQKNNLSAIKKCKPNCLCENRLKIISWKIPQNELDQKFIDLQMEEETKKYIECFKKKTN